MRWMTAALALTVGAATASADTWAYSYFFTGGSLAPSGVSGAGAGGLATPPSLTITVVSGSAPTAGTENTNDGPQQGYTFTPGTYDLVFALSQSSNPAFTSTILSSVGWNYADNGTASSYEFYSGYLNSGSPGTIEDNDIINSVPLPGIQGNTTAQDLDIPLPVTPSSEVFAFRLIVPTGATFFLNSLDPRGDATPIPEPATLASIGAAIFATVLVLRRRKSSATA